MCLGFESFLQEDLDRLNKGTTVEQNLKTIKKLRNLYGSFQNFTIRFLTKISPLGHILGGPAPTYPKSTTPIQIFQNMPKHHIFMLHNKQNMFTHVFRVFLAKFTIF